MNNLKSDFKVFVSDEILDFRTLEEKYSRPRPANLLQRTYSQDAIDISKGKDIPFVKRQVTTIESIPISKPVYSSTDTLADKYRYPRLKSRSKTVDPRFRKSRSPTHKIISASQSTSDIVVPMSPQPKKKPFSPNHLKRISVNRKVGPRNTEELCEDVATSTPSFTDHDDQEYICNEGTTEPKNTQTTNDEQEKYYISTQGDGCNLSSPPDITESEICEEPVEEYDDNDDMESAATSFDKISPYWDDPRLLAKHNDVMQPIRPQHSKHTMPLPKKQPNDGIRICRNCLTSEWITPGYKYDDKTELCNSSLITEDNGSDAGRRGDVSNMVPYVALGSIVAILFFSFIGWFISHCVHWNVSNLWLRKAASRSPETWYWIYYKKYSDNILYWMDVLYNKVYEVVHMPRSGVHSIDGGTGRQSSRWW